MALQVPPPAARVACSRTVAPARMLIRCICTENRFQHEVRMQREVGLLAGMGLAFLVFVAPPARAAGIAAHISTIRAISAEGRGNQEAALAWRELARHRAGAMIEILEGLDGANPLAANYLRSAVETISQKEL